MRLLRTAIPFFVVAVWCFSVGSPPALAISKRAEEVGREVIVKIQGDALTLPEGVTAVGPSGLRSVSPGLGRLLAELHVEQVARSFPGAREPLVKRNRDGVAFRDIELNRIFTLRLPTAEARAQLVDRLRGLPEVIFAEANALQVQRTTPNDPDFLLQWNMQNGGQYNGKPGSDIHAGSAWDLHQGSAAEIVGIVDGGHDLNGNDVGVDPSHTDFEGRVFGAVGGGPDLHATHVAGIAAAVGNNLVGVAGVNWRCGIRSDIIYDENQTAGAIRGSVDAGAKVLNNSWGQTGTSGPLPCQVLVGIEGAFAYAYKNNALCFIAMPQTGSTCDYPNAYLGGKGIVNVGASDNSDNVTSYSFAKSYIDVIAPGGSAGLLGQQIFSTEPGSGYGYLLGTSMATPHATGGASLLKSYGTILGLALYNDDLKQLLRLSATDIGTAGFDNASGMGRIDLRRAMDLLSAPNIFHQKTDGIGGTDVASWSSYQGMSFLGVPGLPDGNYIAKQHTIDRVVTFFQTYTSAPQVWGRGVATIGFTGSTSNYGLGHCLPVPGTITATGCTMRTFVYDVRNLNGQPLGWFPTTAGNVSYAWSELYIAPINTSLPSTLQSYFVPQIGTIASPSEGSTAIAQFRACPDNDGTQVLANNARIKIVVKDAAGVAIAGIPADEIFVALNGGTAAQGYSGTVADSTIANSQYNSTCPDVRRMQADAPTDASGTTYITFRGATPGSPGVATRDPLRKWGHYDAKLPVFVRGSELQGRLTSGSGNGTYALQIKSMDILDGLGTGFNVGEAVTSSDYNDVVAHNGQADSVDPGNWWRDFDSSGTVNSIDINFIGAHVNHGCTSPSNP